MKMNGMHWLWKKPQGGKAEALPALVVQCWRQTQELIIIAAVKLAVGQGDVCGLDHQLLTHFLMTFISINY